MVLNLFIVEVDKKKCSNVDGDILIANANIYCCQYVARNESLTQHTCKCVGFMMS